MKVRVIALGSPHGGDDEVALVIADRLSNRLADGLAGRLADPAIAPVEILMAGRPGAGLVELLDTTQAVLLLDVVRSGRPPGTVLELSLAQLAEGAIAGEPISSHGFGPSEALRLAAALGRTLPAGRFVGIEGERFEIGAAPSERVAAAMDAFEARARAAVLALLDRADIPANPEEPCTSRG